LTASGSETIAHHADGPRLSDATHTYDLDALGRVVRIRDASTSAVLVSFTYDALSRIASGQLGNAPFKRWYLEGDCLHEESPGGTVVLQNVPGPLGILPLAQLSPAGLFIPLADGALSVVGITDSSGTIVERVRFDPFGQPTIYDPAGANILPTSAVGFRPIFGGMTYLHEVGLYHTSARLYDPKTGVFLARDKFLYHSSPSPYLYAAHNPVDLVDTDGRLAFLGILVVIAIGAVAGAGMNAARQGIQMAEDPTKTFSWGEVGRSALLGGALAPALVYAPVLAIPLAGLGVGSAVNEFSQGHVATGVFDLATSALPFMVKAPGGRLPAPLAGLRASHSARAARFSQIGEATANLASKIYYARFYRGGTSLAAEAAQEGPQALLSKVLEGQRDYQKGKDPELGVGLYFNREPGSPTIKGSSLWWAEAKGPLRGNGMPTLLEGRIPRWLFTYLRTKRGVKVNEPQEPWTAPESLQTVFPVKGPVEGPHSGPGATFANWAKWRVVPPGEPPPSFSGLKHAVPASAGANVSWPEIQSAHAHEGPNFPKAQAEKK
jgi:RHS repeat-associated protein